MEIFFIRVEKLFFYKIKKKLGLEIFLQIGNRIFLKKYVLERIILKNLKKNLSQSAFGKLGIFFEQRIKNSID